jgi:hypothetical protein
MKMMSPGLREPKRDATRAKAGFQQWSAQRRAERRRDWARYTELATIATPGVDQPCCMVCGGRSQTWDGHDGCRGRHR